MTKLLTLGALFVAGASAQTFSFGIIGGAPFTDVAKATTQNNLSFVPKSTNFTVGPAFQVNLPLSLRFEVDALYRPYSFRETGTTPVAFVNDISASQWRFPFLLQYRLGTPVVKPFV